MLDIQFIRDNPALVKEKSQQKGYRVDIDQLLELDGKRRECLSKVEQVRQKRNEHAQMMQKQKPTTEKIEAGKALKDELAQLEKTLKTIEAKYTPLLLAVPNMPLEDVPVGESEADNKVVKTVGQLLDYDFTTQTHWQLGEAKDLIDKQRAAKVAGSRFTYLKAGLVRLQFALVQFVLDMLADEKLLEEVIKTNQLSVPAKPFVPVLPPALVNTSAYLATTRLDADEVTYKLADDELWLNASAEHSLVNMYMDEILSESMLPIRYVGYSTSFRREAGSYGKDIEGIIRMHQFDKLEMEVFSTPETGLEEHRLLIALQENLMKALGLSYQVVNKCTADIGKANAHGVDINCWFAGEGKYRETHTADYMTDYQARALKTRLRREDGTIELVHTNDATAFALGRIMAAIMEHYQTHDGHIIVPEALRPYTGGNTQL